MRRKHVRNAVGVVGGSALFLVGLIGFAHTPAGRPLLGAMGVVFRGKACPLGYDRTASPQAREQARIRFAASHRGQVRAESRPALGFVLDHTSRAEVLSFMSSHGITCRTSTPAADLICENVSSQTLPDGLKANQIRDLLFNFGIQNQLISLVAMSRNETAPQVSAAFTEVTGVIGRRAGPPTHINGPGDPQSLGAGTLRQASREFAFADYYACARATNMGKDFLLTEEYRSLPN